MTLPDRMGDIFQMQTHVNINLSTLDYQKLSDPFELFTFMLNDPDDHGRIPSYLNQTTSIRVPAVESGQVRILITHSYISMYVLHIGELCDCRSRMLARILLIFVLHFLYAC